MYKNWPHEATGIIFYTPSLVGLRVQYWTWGACLVINVETNNQHIPPIDMEAHHKFQGHLSSRLGLYYIIQGYLRSKPISEDPKNPIG